jgi:hypothetical protein
VPFALEVAALAAFDVVLRPQKQSGTTEGSFSLMARNDGNADLTVQFEATDPMEGCWYTFAPPQVVVPAGQHRQVQLSVRPRAPLPGEQPRAYPFTVTARPAEAAELARQVQGEWTQTARRVRDLRPILWWVLGGLLLIGAIAAVIAFWPSISSLFGGRGAAPEATVPIPSPDAPSTAPPTEVPPPTEPSPTGLTEATSTPYPTATPYPTGEPTPTATPPPTHTPLPTHTPEPTEPLVPSIAGTWIGTLEETSGAGRTFTAAVVIVQAPGSTTFTGDVFLYLNGALFNHYPIEGTFDGAKIRFNEPDGRHFWGTVDSGRLAGQVAWNCYECSGWGVFDLTGPWNGAMAGVWTGTLTETTGDGRTFKAILVINHSGRSNTFAGTIEFYLDDLSESYTLLDGTVDGTGFRCREEKGRHFWGTVSGNHLEGRVAWHCYDCSHWGVLDLFRE